MFGNIEGEKILKFYNSLFCVCSVLDYPKPLDNIEL